MRYRLLLVCVVLLFCGLSAVSQGEALPGMRPQTYDEGCDVAGWLVSEKLDGVRAYWDGATLWSKNGKRLQPPPEFVAQLPDFAVEGELWAGRGSYEKTASIVLQQQPHAGWRQLHLAIFDVPAEPGTFIQRIAKARAWFTTHPSPYAFVIAQTPVRDRSELQLELKRVQELGGEGLIVRNPDALYAAGRSAEVLKIKEYADAEAVVIAHLPGQGQNLGKLGALLVERSDGTRFRIGSGFSAAERCTPPAIGAVITYKYYGFFASGLPRFPSFLRIRQDQAL